MVKKTSNIKICFNYTFSAKYKEDKSDPKTERHLPPKKKDPNFYIMNGSSYKIRGGANGAIRKSGLNGLTNGGTNGYHHPDQNGKLNGTHTAKPVHTVKSVHTVKPGTIQPKETTSHTEDLKEKVNGAVNGYHTDKMNGSVNGNITDMNGSTNGNHLDNGHDSHDDDYEDDDDELPDDFLDELNGLYCGGAQEAETKKETDQVASWGSAQHKPAMTKQQESR